jgi:cobalt-zinc-cadmium efflux system outer membrane protein
MRRAFTPHRCFARLLLFGMAAAHEPSLGASAQTNAPPLGSTLTLADAKRIAFQRNWDLLAARSDVDAATAQRIVSREFPNPTFSFSTAKIPIDQHSSSTGSGNGLWDRSYDTIAAINQLFEIGGKRSSRRNSAAAGLKAAEARLLDARRVLDQAVTRAYVAALLADANVRILRQSADSLRQEATIAGTRLNAGDISLADKSQIEIAADRLELDADSARTAALSARVAVENLMGAAHPDGSWTASDSLEELAREPAAKNIGTCAAGDAFIARPDWLAAEAALRKAEADVKLQKAMRIPDPTLLFQYEHEPPDQPNTVGLGVSLPLPLWNRNRGNILAAEAAREQAADAMNRLQAQIAAELVTTRADYDSAAARSRRYREEIQPRSAEILKTVSFAYEKGGASLLDLLSAERNDNDVRLATAQAAADSASAAADLRAALNTSNEHTSSP